jgi:cytochrome c-550 PedF
MHLALRSAAGLALLVGLLVSPVVLAHGDVQPQPVDVSTLKPLGEALLEVNPYRGDPEAIRVGTSGYAQNCARCHGLQGMSGGMSPDLREMDTDAESDKYFLGVTMKGRTRNGKVYMPPYKETMSQEAIWAIRAYIESLPKPE